jgi:hypothetical protein
VQNGGTLIAYQDAIKWLNTAKLIELTLKQIKMKLKNISFEEKDDFRAQLVAGAIFEAQLDLSHPINFGMPRNKLPMFRNTSIFLEPNKTAMLTRFSIY